MDSPHTDSHKMNLDSIWQPGLRSGARGRDQHKELGWWERGSPDRNYPIGHIGPRSGFTGEALSEVGTGAERKVWRNAYVPPKAPEPPSTRVKVAKYAIRAAFRTFLGG